MIHEKNQICWLRIKAYYFGVVSQKSQFESVSQLKKLEIMLFEKCIDGFIKISIPELDIVTYASDLEDAQVAIAEAIELHRIISNQFVSISEKK